MQSQIEISAVQSENCMSQHDNSWTMIDSTGKHITLIRVFDGSAYRYVKEIPKSREEAIQQLKEALNSLSEITYILSEKVI